MAMMTMVQTKAKGGSNLKVGSIKHISIDFLDDGVTVSCERKMKPAKPNEPRDWDAGATRKAFNDLDEAHEYIGQLLRDAPKDQTPKGKPGKKAAKAKPEPEAGENGEAEED